MNKVLTIFITDKCNLSCSFCKEDDNMKNLGKPNKELDLILEEHISQVEYDEFFISGGEPFLDVKMLEKVLSVLLSHSLTKPITINTNGTYIDSTIVNNLAQFENIRFQISLDGLSGEFRGLNTLISNGEYKKGLLAINYIKAIPNKHINFVLQRKKLNDLNLAVEILSLYSIFGCLIQLLIDETELDRYNIDDAFNLQNLLIRLKELGVMYSVGKLFQEDCNGDCNVDLYWTGEIRQECNTTGVGCSDFRRKMKPGMYDLLCRIALVDKPYYEINADKNYIYSLESNVQKRETEFTPKFKHSIDGNRRFKDAAIGIKIKEVT